MITGFILAGGASSRMGRDKALLPMGRHTLIELVIRRLQPFVTRLIVIGHPGNLHQLCEYDVDGVAIDAAQGYGPLMGVYTGLMQAETTLGLFVPCDMPWVEERLIERLLDRCTLTGAAVVAGRHPVDGVQPFPLVCRTTACRTIGRLLNTGERSLQVLVRQPGADVVTIDEPELWRSFTNVNTRDDYEQLSQARPFAP